MQSLPIKVSRFSIWAKRLSFFALLPFAVMSLGTTKTQAQDIPTGTWRTHLTYYNAQAMVKAKERIYVASQNGFFYFDTSDNSLNTLSKEDGLSDINITALAYAESLDMLIVGYATGNIDLITSSEIINIRSIVNSLSFRNKAIRNIAIQGNKAYLALPFGVSVIDLELPIIEETYLNIGENGTENGVFDIDFVQDSIFLATQQGVWSASLAPNVNRLDFRNWDTPVKGQGVRHLAVLENQLFYTVEGDGLYGYANGTTQVASFGRGENYRGLSASSGTLILCLPKALYLATSLTTAEIRSGENIQLPIEAIVDNATLWTADTALGLVRFQGNSGERFAPSGPFSPSVFRLRSIGNRMYATAGGINEATGSSLRNIGSFYVFEDGIWTNYTAAENSVGAIQIPPMTDLSYLSLGGNGNIYLGSFGTGLLEWNTEQNEFTPLQNTPLTPATGIGTAVGGLATDVNGNLWVSNYGVANASMHALSPNGDWQSFQFGSFATRFPREIVIDELNQKWVRLAGTGARGVLVFEDENNFRILREGVGNGDLPSSVVNCLAKDLEGSIWIGTDRGVAGFFDPFSALTSANTDVVLPRFEGLPLLRDENVTSIAIDGGNRKWIGTENGAWLFNEDGSRLVHHFTEENSPLLSNQIIDIGINPKSGEVFFGTAAGIISYRSDATLTEVSHGNVKIFPNPVRPNYNGLLTIAELARDAIIKITDVSGKLIWQTRAQGGTATWDLQDYNGKRAKTGVYLIFSASSDGEQTFVGKVAVVE